MAGVVERQVPFLLTGVEEVAELTGKLFDQLNNMRTNFMNDAKVCLAKGGSGRAQQTPSKDHVRKEMMDAIAPLTATLVKYLFIGEAGLLEAMGEKEGCQEAKTAMAISLFGMEKGSEHCGPERHLLGSLRLPLSGTRQIVAIRWDDLYEFMAGESVPKVPMGKDSEGAAVMGYPLDQMNMFFRNMSDASMKKFVEFKNTLIYGTAPCKELLVVPPCWLVAESIHVDAHVFGMKVGVLPRAADSALLEVFQNLVSMYAVTSKSTAVLEVVRDVMLRQLEAQEEEEGAKTPLPPQDEKSDEKNDEKQDEKNGASPGKVSVASASPAKAAAQGV